MKRISLNGLWKLSGNGYECVGTIPGSVYSILLENELMDDPYYRENEKKALEIAEHDYTFLSRFHLIKMRILLYFVVMDQIRYVIYI